MSKVIKGYSGITNPPNLATNGGMLINQRGGTGTYRIVTINDYIADCWKVRSLQNVDYCEAIHVSSGGLGFQGYGKKGQLIYIYNRDNGLFGQSTVSGDINKYGYTTAAISVYNRTSGSVPIQCGVRPPYFNSTPYTFVDTKPILKPGNYGDSVCVMKDPGNVHSTYGEFWVTLLETGEFAFDVYPYRHLAGAFENPPKYSFVNYADDLARCQRYYQKGTHISAVRGVFSAADTAETRHSVSFATEMISAPTVTTTLTGATIYTDNAGSSSDLSASSYSQALNAAVSEFTMRQWLLHSTYAPHFGNYGGIMSSSWVAEVA